MKTMLVGLMLMSAGASQCAPPEGSPEGGEAVRLTVEPGEVRAGDEVTLTLVNGTEHHIGYNLCPAVLDRREGSDWVERPERPAEFCTMELRVLEPGGSTTYPHTVPAGLPAGEYRFRVGVEAPLGEGRLEIATPPFRIGAG